MRPPTDNELRSLPHILLTSDAVWDPSSLDDEFTCDELAQDTSIAPSDLDLDPRVNDFGAYTGNLDDDIDLILAECCQARTVAHTVSVAQPNLEILRPLFGWVPVDRIKKTIAATNQFARASVRLPMRASTSSRGFLPAMSIDGMRAWLQIHSFVTLPPTTMVSWVMVVLLWLNSSLAKIRLLSTP